jgi:predicted transcriptional regulator
MSATTPTTASGDLSEKQRRILQYLQRNEDQTYFKSRLIGSELDLSAKEVGANMQAIDETANIDVEKWGYSSSTTWKVTGRT